ERWTTYTQSNSEVRSSLSGTWPIRAAGISSTLSPAKKSDYSGERLRRASGASRYRVCLSYLTVRSVDETTEAEAEARSVGTTRGCSTGVSCSVHPIVRSDLS